MSELRVKNLHVTLGGNKILNGINLDFEAHRIHSILGPNGCGKTTLIRAISGAIPLAGGCVELSGESINTLSASMIARKMAVVWQGGQVNGDITVRRLVGYGRYAHLPWWQLRPPQDEPAITAAMRRTGVLEFAERRVDTLSGGERQRVWLAAALAQEPQVLLLDEPTTYLDIAHQIDILELVRSLNAEQGLTVVMVLHDLSQAARYADHCVVLGDGRVLREGSPAEALSWQAIGEDFGVDSWVTLDPTAQLPVISPRRRVSPTGSNSANGGRP